MRIKRFLAPDMRTALRMVRDEQGPDAVILSNRATAEGIEVVAATDYDESLVAQALRAAAPAIEPATAPPPSPSAAIARHAPHAGTAWPSPASAVADAPTAVMMSAPLQQDQAPAIAKAAVASSSATLTREFQQAPRESLMSKARAIFKIGDGPDADGPTLAELTAAQFRSAPVAFPDAAVTARADAQEGSPRFDAMMAALGSTVANAPIAQVAASHPGAVTPTRAQEPAPSLGDIPAQPTHAYPNGEPSIDVDGTSDAHYLVSLTSVAGQVPTAMPAAPGPSPTTITVPIAIAPRTLHAVPGDAPETDPAIVAMRRELATMRELMEKQMEQLSLERLRGSPARAAALDAMLGLGCDIALAQAVASRLDPRIAPSQIQAPMLAELVRSLSIARSEPIDDGGVIALVGPTGAGKTTTAAKLAARFAARHRARDVALVSIDRERTGAHEQLHALGRRLGVTVCDADGSDGLGKALEQLVDYPLILVDTAGYGVRDRALLRQILWLRSSSRMRSLLVLPANAHPHDLGEVILRYRPAAPEGVVLTKLDETGRLGASLSALAQYDLPLAYTCAGQQVPTDLEAASDEALVRTLQDQALHGQAFETRATEQHAEPHAAGKPPFEKLALQKSPGAADNPLATEDRHAFA